jgi:hypothetical protein
MKDKIIGLFEKYGRVFVLCCIVISTLGLIASYVFPNVVLDTEPINMEENSDFHIPLTIGSVIEYKCKTGTQQMAGIQVGISKEGAEFTDGKVVYEIYNGDSSVLLGAGEQLLKDISDFQEVYLPFTGMKEYNGALTIKFYYTGSETTAPALIANQTKVKDASTYVEGNLITGNLKSYYIYSRNTYPLVFDLKIMLAIFVIVFCTFESKTKKKVNE